MKALQFAAIFVAALILGALAASLFDTRPGARFAAIGGGDGATLWRVDLWTGRVSVCGSSLTGASLAQAESQLSAHVRTAGANPDAQASLGPEIADLNSLSRPRCSPWSMP